MTAEQFTYWLQGYFEINDPDRISPMETKIIKDHLALVFKKETPNRTVTVPDDTSIWRGPHISPSPAQPPYTTSPYPDWINKPTVYCSTDTDKKIC